MAQELLLVNPRKRRKSTKKRRKATKKRSISRAVARKTTKRRTYRRNPISRKGIMESVMPAAQGALGATLLDLAMGYLPIPETVKAGPMRHVVKGVAAIGLGILAKNIVKGQTAANLANGALTVIMHDAIKEQGTKMGLPLAGYDEIGYYNPAMVEGDMGAYLPDDGMAGDSDYYMGAYEPEETFEGMEEFYTD